MLEISSGTLLKTINKLQFFEIYRATCYILRYYETDEFLQSHRGERRSLNRRIVATIFIIFIHSYSRRIPTKISRSIPRYDQHHNSPPFRVRRLKKELRRRKVAEATTLRGGRYQLICNLEAGWPSTFYGPRSRACALLSRADIRP